MRKRKEREATSFGGVYRVRWLRRNRGFGRCYLATGVVLPPPRGPRGRSERVDVQLARRVGVGTEQVPDQ